MLENKLAILFLAVPRLVCGLLLTLDFGSANLACPGRLEKIWQTFEEVAFFGFLMMLLNMGVFAVFPSFWHGWGHLK